MAAMVATGAVAASGRSVAGEVRECLTHLVTASGRPAMFTVHERAKGDAIATWEHLVAWQAGARFAHWENAREKRIECRMLNRSVSQCLAIARPCGSPKGEGVPDAGEREGRGR